MLNLFISIIFGSLVFSSALAAEQFTCKTSAHIVTIDQLSSNQYQYMAWNRPKNITKKPDMVIGRGKEITEGTGVCRYTRWEFNNRNTQYVVSTPVTCTEDLPPSNATGRLSIFENG